jgi:Mrp family chromosome partitioning ATPase
MVSVLDQLRQHYEVIVIDAPPVLAVTDAVVLAPHVDAVLLVARFGNTARGAITETRRQLSSVNVRAAGLVLNAVPKSEANAYYGRYIYTIKPRRLGSRRAG